MRHGSARQQVAIVTGASDEIGLAIAQRFADEGARVYMTGRRKQELDSAVAKVGHGAIGVQADATSSEDMDRLYAAVDGNIDVVVANVGFGEFVRLEDVTDEHYQRIFDINVKGTVYTVRKALPKLADHASIVLVTSMAGRGGQEGLGTYAASKAAVRSFARTWANELKDRHIRVNALAPGSTDTPAMDAVLKQNGIDSEDAVQEWKAKQTSNASLRRMAQPEEQASAALFLASSESSYITGTELTVDGGVTETITWGSH
ncbi:SDR family oxidoreductase [Kibdelosporangium philippinense]|uniref:SDR family oxidoreductase n=1 Tax=Kibdelosporangium philippinense TaxID=211113 RepID=A0ABS8Z8G4_9PSEU|nr:SDR family oxidoreductase [Kibdelosporangium philippinense]MCE7002853.1 SDR family oxidoreductase [Kibdelosporangium philippinense]